MPRRASHYLRAKRQVVKTRKGVNIEFLRATKDDPHFTPEQRGFLSKAYDFKAVADYDTRPIAEVSSQEAADAIEAARKFVATVRHALTRSRRIDRLENGDFPDSEVAGNDPAYSKTVKVIMPTLTSAQLYPLTANDEARVTLFLVIPRAAKPTCARRKRVSICTVTEARM